MSIFWPLNVRGEIAAEARRRGVTRQAESARRIAVARRAAGLCARCGAPSESYWCEKCYRKRHPRPAARKGRATKTPTAKRAKKR